MSDLIEEILKDYPEYERGFAELAESEVRNTYDNSWHVMAEVHQVEAILNWMAGYLYAMDLHKTGVT